MVRHPISPLLFSFAFSSLPFPSLLFSSSFLSSTSFSSLLFSSLLFPSLPFYSLLSSPLLSPSLLLSSPLLPSLFFSARSSLLFSFLLCCLLRLYQGLSVQKPVSLIPYWINGLSVMQVMIMGLFLRHTSPVSILLLARKFLACSWPSVTRPAPVLEVGLITISNGRDAVNFAKICGPPDEAEYSLSSERMNVQTILTSCRSFCIITGLVSAVRPPGQPPVSCCRCRCCCCCFSPSVPLFFPGWAGPARPARSLGRSRDPGESASTFRLVT